ncbi:peptidylprolyl isomerase [uncultured Sunxiuqinia sp.]|uniref:peptidylprolyl isomerase n=1 Tax=uncultured Sunxiuqinia sp. TaxID=1573825 RepID=UPI002AA60AAF|nr:peptidylprolyl isomerase [uncultured Sunxiuqinia sp.]
MKQLLFAFLIATFFIQTSCGNSTKKTSKETKVKIETEYGDLIVKLYNQTPQHRDNFIKLAKEGFYDDLLFHRVINGFMIQGGDPDSKNAEAGKRLGGGDPGYTIPAEIDSSLFHKKGVLAAARRGGPGNPEKRSSGSQFYVVQGTVFTEGAIDTMEMKLNMQRQRSVMQKYFQGAQQELNQLKQEGDQDQLNIRVAEIREQANQEISKLPTLKISPERREIYTTIGGYPSLDNEYTVFGEIVEGLDVLDKIAGVETDQYDRPTEDIKMKVKVID